MPSSQEYLEKNKLSIYGNPSLGSDIYDENSAWRRSTDAFSLHALLRPNKNGEAKESKEKKKTGVGRFFTCFTQGQRKRSSMIGGKKKSNNKLVDIETILSDRYLRGGFEHFLISEYSIENMDFYENVQQYKRAWYDYTTTTSRSVAKKIMANYIGGNSRNEINIKDETMLRITRAMAEEDSSKKLREDIFDEAFLEIKRIMESDSLPRFLKQLEKQKLEQQERPKSLDSSKKSSVLSRKSSSRSMASYATADTTVSCTVYSLE